MASSQISVKPKKTSKNQLKNYLGIEVKMERPEVHFEGHIEDIYNIYLFLSVLRCV